VIAFTGAGKKECVSYRTGGIAAFVMLMAVVLAATIGAGGGAGSTHSIDPAIHTIRHVVVIMQENRSFDSYFGTYPGANGIPMRNGAPTVCVPIRHAAAASVPTTMRTT
jgi:phospholipase C